MRSFSTFSKDYGPEEVHGMEEAQTFLIDQIEEVEDRLLGSSLMGPEECKELGERLKGLRLMLDEVFGEVNEITKEEIIAKEKENV
jgi:hypothetical protein